MNPRFIALLKLLVLVGVIVVLFVIFPAAFRFVEAAAMEARYFWWLILLLALAVWLIWGLGRKPKK